MISRKDIKIRKDIKRSPEVEADAELMVSLYPDKRLSFFSLLKVKYWHFTETMLARAGIMSGTPRFNADFRYLLDEKLIAKDRELLDYYLTASGRSFISHYFGVTPETVGERVSATLERGKNHLEPGFGKPEERGAFPIVRACFRAATLLDPENAVPWYWLGWTYTFQENWFMARAAHLRATALDPDGELTPREIKDSYVKVAQKFLSMDFTLIELVPPI